MEKHGDAADQQVMTILQYLIIQPQPARQPGRVVSRLKVEVQQVLRVVMRAQYLIRGSGQNRCDIGVDDGDASWGQVEQRQPVGRRRLDQGLQRRIVQLLHEPAPEGRSACAYVERASCPGRPSS
jgi:hypothetical protein